MFRAAVVALLLALLPPFAAAAPLERLAGLELEVVPDPADPALLRCRAVWSEAAPLGRVTVDAPVGATVLGEPGDLWLAEGARRVSSRLDVRPGAALEVVVDLGGLAGPWGVVVAAERVLGDVTEQLAVRADLTPSGTAVAPATASRLTRLGGDPPAPPGGPGSDDRPLAGVSAGVVLIEPLAVAGKTLAEVFAEDPAGVAIPDGPTVCGSTSTTWPVQRAISVSSAPATAVVSALTIHVTVTHPDMSDLEIGFFHNPGGGNYLWNRDPGTNLDRDYTRDIFNHQLDGIGEAVNALYMLSVRDCAATDTGTLDYWSVRVTYVSSPTIDLVADSASAAPASVAPGAATAVAWAGHVGGSGTVGGPFSVGFYLSSDPTVTTADLLLGEATVSAPNDPGDTFGQAAHSVTIPASTAPGSYVLGVIVDRTNAIAESDETNNTASALLTVAVPPSNPNLRAVSCSVNPPTVAAGGAVNFTWRGDNPTGTASGPFSWALYLSTDPTLTPGVDTLLAGPENSTGWGAGFDTGNVSRSVTLPPGSLPAATTWGWYSTSPAR